MVKPRERNTRYVDAVMTVPKGTLFPMCGMNLAFDRYMQFLVKSLSKGGLGTLQRGVCDLHCLCNHHGLRHR